jgi:hypothetical protein
MNTTVTVFNLYDLMGAALPRSGYFFTSPWAQLQAE